MGRECSRGTGTFPWDDGHGKGTFVWDGHGTGRGVCSGVICV